MVAASEARPAVDVPAPARDAERMTGKAGLWFLVRTQGVLLAVACLGAALSEYARSAGTSSGIRVHLSLKEGSTRLPADAEVGLLRIAHEAVGRARRRPGTANLWVSLEVDPPSAALVVEDDALDTGPGDDAATRAMADRAQALGACFSASDRLPAGSRISVTLGGQA